MTLGAMMEIARDFALPQNATGGYGIRPYALLPIAESGTSGLASRPQAGHLPAATSLPQSRQ